MKATYLILSGLLVTAAIAAMAPPATAHHGPASCTAEIGDTFGQPGAECTFSCHKGDQLTLSVQPNSPGRRSGFAKITCGGLWFRCVYSDYTANSCQSLPDTVQYDDVGTCVVETLYTRATCTASPTPLSTVYAVTEARAVGAGVQALSTPLVPDTEVWIPVIPETCAPSNLICVGNEEPDYVTTIEGVDPIPLTPASGASVAWTDPSLALPTVETSSIGPYPVLTDPVEVTLCKPSCDGVPTGVSGGLSATLTVTVYVGTTVVSYNVTLP